MRVTQNADEMMFKTVKLPARIRATRTASREAASVSTPGRGVW